MPEIADLTARFTADTTQFKAGVAEARTAMETFTSNSTAGLGGFASTFQTAMTGMRSSLREFASSAAQTGMALSAALTLPLGAMFRLGLGFDDIKRRTEMTFEVMYHSAAVAKELTSQLSAFSINAPYRLRDVLNTSKMLAGGGVSPDEIIKSMQAIGDAGATKNGTGFSLERIARALIEIKNLSGPVGQQMRMLTLDANTNGWTVLSAHLHKTQAQIKELVKTGKLSGSTLYTDLVSGIEEHFKGMMQKQMKTLSGAFTSIMDALDQSLGSLFQPIYNDVVTVIQKLNVALLGVRKGFQSLSAPAREAASTILMVVASAGPLALAIAGISMAAEFLLSPMGALTAAVALATSYFVTHKKAAVEMCQIFKDNLPIALGIASAAVIAFTGVLLKNAGAAMLAFGKEAIAFLVTPVGMVAAAITVGVGIIALELSYVLGKYWDLNKGTKDVWSRIEMTIWDVVMAVGLRLNDFIQDIADAVLSVQKFISSILGMLSHIPVIGKSFDPLLTDWKVIGDGFQQTANRMKDAITSVSLSTAFQAISAVDDLHKIINKFHFPLPHKPDTKPPGTPDGKTKTDPVTSFLTQQAKQLYDLHHTGDVATVVWSRLHGALKKATTAQYDQALATAKQIDAITKLQSVMSSYQSKLAELQKTAALGTSPSAMASLHYSFNHELAGLSPIQRQKLITLQSHNDTVAQHHKFVTALNAESTKQSDDANKALESSFNAVRTSIANMQKQLTLGAHATELQKVMFEQAGSAAQKAAQGGDIYAQILLNMQRNVAAAVDKQNALNAATKIYKEITSSIAQKVLDAQNKLAAANSSDPGWFKFVGSYMDKISKMDFADQIGALAKLRQAYETISIADKSASSQSGFRGYMANLRKEQMQQNAHGGFQQFSAGFLQSKNGEVTQPYNNTQLEQMYQLFLKLHPVITQFQASIAKAASTLQQGFQKALTGLFQHGFKNFFSNVVGGFDSMLQQMAAKWLASQMMQLFEKGLSSLVSALGGNGASITQAFGGFKAAGGPVTGGVPYIVGERGAEMFVPHSSGHIVPNHQLGGGGHTFHITINNPADGNSVRQSMGQAMNDAGLQLAYWQGRNS